MKLRDVFNDPEFVSFAVNKLIENQARHVRVLMRETPGDAQFVELTGSMRRNPMISRDPLSFEIHDMPIVVQSMNVPDMDPAEWSSLANHTLNLAVTDYETSSAAGAFGAGMGSGVKDWEVLGIDDYELEGHDADILKAYISSRPELLQHVLDTMSQGLSDYEASIR